MSDNPPATDGSHAVAARTVAVLHRLLAAKRRADNGRSAAIVVPAGFMLKAVDHRLDSNPPYPHYDRTVPGIPLTADLAWVGRRMFLVRGDGPVTPTTPRTDGLVAVTDFWTPPTPGVGPYPWLPDGWPAGVFPLALTPQAVNWWVLYAQVHLRIALPDVGQIDFAMKGMPADYDEYVRRVLPPDHPLFGRRALVVAARLLAARLGLPTTGLLARVVPSDPQDILDEAEAHFAAMNAWTGAPPAGSPSPASSCLGDLKRVAESALLKGISAEIVAAVLTAGGAVDISKLGIRFQWSNVQDNWNSARRRLNESLSPHGLEFFTFDNKATLRHRPDASGNQP